MVKHPGKILITGGSGFLASEISKHFSDKYNVISLSSSKSKSESGTLKLLDWENLESLKEYFSNAELLIHSAGMSSSQCIENIEGAITLNGLQTKKLISFCIANNVKRFFYLSSIHVYKKPFKGLINEQSVVGNNHPYSFTKILAENIVLHETEGSGTEGHILRLSNIFGPHSLENKNLWTLVINQFCLQAFKTNEIIIKGNGEDLRDFLPLSIFLDQILYLAEKKEACLRIMNISSGLTFSIKEIAIMVQKKFEEIVGLYPKIIILNNSHLESTINKFSIQPSLNKHLKCSQREIEKEIEMIIKFLQNERA